MNKHIEHTDHCLQWVLLLVSEKKKKNKNKNNKFLLVKVFCFLFSPIIVGHGKKTKILKKSTVTHHSKKLFPHTLSNLSSVCKNSATSSGVPPRRPFSWRYFTPFLGFLLNLVRKTQTNKHMLSKLWPVKM